MLNSGFYRRLVNFEFLGMEFRRVYFLKFFGRFCFFLLGFLES